MDFTGITNFDMGIMNLINGSDSLFMDNWIMFLTSGFTWIPLYLALIILIARNSGNIRKTILLIVCAAVMVGLIDLFVDVLIKPTFIRYRPSHDPQVQALIDVVRNSRGGAYGFFSAHAANTMGLALFFTLVFKSRLLGVSLIMWSLLNCFTRMYLGMHYPSDILCGILCGSIFAVSAYYMYKYIYSKLFHRTNYISSQYTASGYALSDIDIVISVLLFTIQVGIIYAICNV